MFSKLRELYVFFYEYIYKDRPCKVVEAKDPHIFLSYPVFSFIRVSKVLSPNRRFRLIAELFHYRDEFLEVIGAERDREVEVGRKPYHSVEHEGYSAGDNIVYAGFI